MKNIHTYGLLARRDVQACASSSDGLFGLPERSSDGSYKFVGLCVLEIKTQSAFGLLKKRRQKLIRAETQD